MEMLEDRTVPASAAVAEHLEAWDLAPNHSPASHHLVNVNGLLTGRQGGDPATIAINYLRLHANELGLSLADTQNYIATNEYVDQDWVGNYHLYLRQTFNELTVANANLNINVTRHGEVINLGSTFYGGLSAWETYPAVAPTPGISAADAIVATAIYLGYAVQSAPTVAVAPTGLDQNQVLWATDASQLPIATKLAYIVMPDGAHLTWNFSLQTPDGEHWYDAHADANTGELLHLADWTDHASYQVYPIPLESPSDGGIQTVIDPAHATASPFGWHDTNGVAGAEFTDTRGNNVNAQEDADANNSGGARPSGGASLDFLYPIDLAQAPAAYTSGATVNLFYWNNILHDVHYQYGFTPAAGNFQVNNYGGGGLGNDQVNADAQDGSGVNNANFSTPADGSAPRMQQYIFTAATPDRDSSLDAGIIAHEYGHGVSNRLTGGPANSGALNNLQSGGMGEGWSDFFALMFTQVPTDLQNSAYPVGTYALGQASNGPGIRRQPYSYNMAINNQTIGWYNSSQEVHNSGELWCTALWDLNWLLINKFGYDSNIYTGYAPGGGPASAGNKLMLRLVLDAMKLQPANPSFLDARNAIFAADQALTGGANKAEIWQAFARRGMGVSFIDAGSNANTVTEAFDLPAPFALPLTPIGTLGTLAYEGNASGALVIVGAIDAFSLSLDAGQRATIYVTPTAAGLRPTVEFRDPSNALLGSNTASAAGAKASLEGISLTTTGTHTISVSGNASTVGSYTIRLVLNAVVEAESAGGAANNSTAAAQNLNAMFTAAGSGDIATVMATSDLGGTMPMETESNGTTATANSLASNFNAVNNGVYQLGIDGNIGSGTDVDWFNIGALQVGDVITVSQAASGASRGSNTDPYVYLFRAGSGTYVVRDDDNGQGTDSLIYRYSVAIADTYYIAAYRYDTSNTGSYELGVSLENVGPAPLTGGSFTAEVEGNDTIGAANDASNAWRKVDYLSRTNGVISTTADVDMYSATFQAGDLVTAFVRSLSGLDARISLLNSAGTAIAIESGEAGLGSNAAIFGYNIPSTGIYYFNVRAVSGSLGTGAYYLDVSASTPASFPPTTPVPDHYSFTLTAGQKTSWALRNATAGSLTLDLLDAGGGVIASAAAGATNYDLLLNNFTAPSTGTYFARVVGQGLVNYNLSVSRGIGAEAENNDSFAAGQAIEGDSSTLGHTANDDYFRVNLAAGQTITLQTSTPGDGAGQFVNNLNPALDFYDPAGVLLVSDDNSAPDGRNALLVRTVGAAGLYGIRVRGTAATTGEYVLSSALSAGDTTAPTVTGLFFDGAWAPAFRTAAGNATYGYPAQAGAGQLTPMPWSTLNVIYVAFSEDVNIQTGDLEIRGINVPTYAPTLASYDSVNFVARFTVPAAFDTDRILLDLDGGSGTAVADLAGNKLAGSWTEGVSSFPTAGAAGADFQYRFVVAVGDVDRNGQVRNADLNLVRNNLFVDVGAGGYSIFADVDGNGQTRNADLNAVRNHLFVDPPAGPGPLRGAGSRAAGAAAANPAKTARWSGGSSESSSRASSLRRPGGALPAGLLDDFFAEI